VEVKKVLLCVGFPFCVYCFWHVWATRDGCHCKGMTQTLIPKTSAVKPKASQSTDDNLLWSVVYISDTVCLCMGAADDLLTS
jgi:hypothetical protein